jgi:SRSO17 transposase
MWNSLILRHEDVGIDRLWHGWQKHARIQGFAYEFAAAA